MAEVAPTGPVDAFIVADPREKSARLIIDGLNTAGVSTYLGSADPSVAEGKEEQRLRDARVAVALLGPLGWGPHQLAQANAIRDTKKRVFPVLLTRATKIPPDVGIFVETPYATFSGLGTVNRLASQIQAAKERMIQGRLLESAEAMAVSDARRAVTSLLEEQDIGRCSNLALQILAIAAAMGATPERAQITSTRLLVGVFEASREREVRRELDSLGTRSLGAVLNRLRGFSQGVRVPYYKGDEIQLGPVRTARASRNVTKILRLALEISSDFAPDKPDELNADGLVAALLRQPSNGMISNLTDQGLSIEQVLEAFMAGLQERDPERLPVWNRHVPILDQSRDPGPRDIHLPYMGNDDPYREGIVDTLGVEEEARAFARIAAVKSITPPLAFGIFGDWGSGKSFFMRLLQAHVDKIATAQAPESNTDLFHSNIVQIRFNAWHYVETNLWASLVDHIFLEMDRWMREQPEAPIEPTVFDKLTSAHQLTLESAETLVHGRQEQRKAAEGLATAQQALSFAQDNVGRTPRLLWEAVRQTLQKTLKDTGATKDFETAARSLGLDNIITNAEQLKTTLDEFKTEANRVRLEGQAIRKRLVKGHYVALALGAIILMPLSWLYLREWMAAGLANDSTLKVVAGEISGAAVGVVAFLASAAVALNRATATVRSAVNRLEGYRTSLDAAIESRLAEEKGGVKNAQNVLAEKTAKVEEAKVVLTSSTERLAEAIRDYTKNTGPDRMINFVRQRATDGQYAKHLGLISLARRDFSELSRLMSTGNTEEQQKAKEAADNAAKAYQQNVEELIERAGTALNPEERERLRKSAERSSDKAAPTFDRIILYIDDLDRCPPLKVIEVLQAVHLLLAFRLFVVVVAVDVRWVSRSLETHYKDLLQSASEEEGAEGAATPRDYLEKIFQIPYWVRPMSKEGSEKLLLEMASHIPEAPRNEEGQQEPEPGIGPERTSEAPAGGGDTVGMSPALPDGQAVSSSQDQIALDEATRQLADQAEAAEERRTQESEKKTVARALVLTPAELECMRQLASFVGGTPRRVLRFANVYRVIKASMDQDELRRLDEGGFRALMTQLAISTAAPSVQKKWFKMVQGWDPTHDSLKEVTVQVRDEARFRTGEGQLAVGAFLTFVGSLRGTLPDGVDREDRLEELFVANIESLQNYNGLARRYSFRD